MLGIHLSAADRYWVASTPGNWSDINNWSNESEGQGGFSIPGPEDKVFFDEFSIGNCIVDIPMDIAALEFKPEFQGTMMQLGHSISIGEVGFVLKGGTFIGGTAPIYSIEKLEIDGTDFTSTTDTLFISNDLELKRGQFHHNDGTIEFNSPARAKFINDLNEHFKVHNVVVRVGAGEDFEIGHGDSLWVENRIDLFSGILRHGELVVEDTAYVHSTWDQGDANITFMGQGNSYYILDNGTWNTNDVYVQKDSSSDSLIVEDGDGDGQIQLGQFNREIEVRRGIMSFDADTQVDLDFQEVINNPGGTLVGTNDTLLISGDYTNLGGRYSHNSGTVRFDGTGDVDFRCDNMVTDRFHNVDIELIPGKQLLIDVGDSLWVEGRLQLGSGKMPRADVVVEDTAYVTSGWLGGDADITFAGSGNSFYLFDSGTWNENNVYIHKETLTDTTFIKDVDNDGWLNLGEDQKIIKITEGTLAFEDGVNVDLDFGEVQNNPGGELIGAMDTLLLGGDYINYGGLFTHNGGTVRFDSDNDVTFHCVNEPTDRFHNIHIKTTGVHKVFIDTLKNMHVENRLQLSIGHLRRGTAVVEDTAYVETTWSGGNADIRFIGSGTSHYLFDNNDWNTNNVTIDKDDPSDTTFIKKVQPNGLLQLGDDDHNLTILNGVLAFAEGVELQLDYFQLENSSGGTLYSTSDTLHLLGNYVNNGGLLVHNNGTVRFIGTRDVQYFCSTVPTDHFFNVDIEREGGKKITIHEGHNLWVENKLLFVKGILDGGTVTVEDTAYVTPTWQRGSSDLNFSGSGNSYYFLDENSWNTNNVSISKYAPTDSTFIREVDNDKLLDLGRIDKYLNINSGVLVFQDSVVADLNFRATRIHPDGTLLGSTGELNLLGDYINLGGNFSHNFGIVNFDGDENAVFQMDKAPSDQFYNVFFDKPHGRMLTLVEDDTLRVGNDLVLMEGHSDQGVFKVEGNVTIESNYDRGTTKLMFAGANDQSFRLEGKKDNFDADVYIDKPTVSDVILQSKFEMTAPQQTLHLKKGMLVTNHDSLLILEHGTYWTDASAISYIDGPIEKFGNEAFTFPVGKNGIYAPISISAPENDGHSFVGEYFRGDAGSAYDGQSLASGLHHVSQSEYWILDREHGASDVFVTLSYDTVRSGGIDALIQVVVSRWDGAMWQDHGNDVEYTGMEFPGAGTITTAQAVTDFSPFTFASRTHFNPLPVEFLYFKAEKNDNAVDISWATGLEVNSDNFLILHSMDGMEWTVLGDIQAAGFSSAERTYRFTHDSPLQGTNYYRLRQVDFDGHSEYTDVEAVNFSNLFIDDIHLFPNPTKGLVSLEGYSGEIDEIRLFDITGRDWSERLIIRPLAGQTYLIDLTLLPEGIYMLRAIGFSRTLVKN
ncbi:MAG: T9SS type A sorting domain-containing protein [Flavobacteriales bacterium]|nr:T9SS type A sorting domain-containing protein [Flavobacteriales bacterium]